MRMKRPGNGKREIRSDVSEPYARPVGRRKLPLIQAIVSIVLILAVTFVGFFWFVIRVEVLARSGGKRVTDSYELFPSPEMDKDGKYRIVFFAHGLRHLPSESVRHVAQLAHGDPLLLAHDLQNEHDRHALLLRTTGDESDRFIVGYLPRYLAGDLIDVVRSKPEEVHIQVEKINPAPAPLQLRMLCRLEASQQSGWQPFRGDRFRPMSARTSDRSPDAT